MSERIFRVDFYPQDWIAGTSQLDLEERGLFIQVVALIYSNRGPIENDPAWIAGVSKCSTKKAKNLLDSLIAKNFLQTNSGGKITQKRAENELKTKRKHLENSAKGGHKRAENLSDDNENNDLASSDDHLSLATPPHTHSTPLHPNRDKLLTPLDSPRDPEPPPEQVDADASVAASGGGVFADAGEGGGFASDGAFSIQSHLTAQDILAASKIAKGFAMLELFRVYDEGVNSGKRSKPDYPAKAFLAWVPLYVQKVPGKPAKASTTAKGSPAKEAAPEPSAQKPLPAELDDIARVLGPAVTRAWFVGTTRAGQTLTAPSKFKADHIRANYGQQLRSIGISTITHPDEGG